MVETGINAGLMIKRSSVRVTQVWQPLKVHPPMSNVSLIQNGKKWRRVQQSQCSRNSSISSISSYVLSSPSWVQNRLHFPAPLLVMCLSPGQGTVNGKGLIQLESQSNHWWNAEESKARRRAEGKDRRSGGPWKTLWRKKPPPSQLTQTIRWYWKWALIVTIGSGSYFLALLAYTDQ